MEKIDINVFRALWGWLFWLNSCLRLAKYGLINFLTILNLKYKIIVGLFNVKKIVMVKNCHS